MAEKKSHKRLIETLRRFIKLELQTAEFLLEKSKAGKISLPEKVEQTAILFLKKDKLNEQGVLSAIYIEYLDYLGITTERERKTVAGAIDKYGRYADALVEVPPNDGYKLSFEANIRKEALRINSTRNQQGVRKFNDMYNADMLYEDFGDDILYCTPWKKWVIWDGRRWSKKNQKMIYHLAKKSIREMNEKALSQANEDDTLILMEHAGRCESMRKLDAMVNAASCDKRIWIEPEDFDLDNMIFNCANGSIDLTTGRLLEHDRSRKITKLSTIEYVENAGCPVWEKFIQEIFKKNNALIKYVQKIVGMCLTGDVSAQSLFILYGKGANGKSTFLNTIMKIMGDYGATTPTETLMQKKGDAASNDIARLQGTRFVSAMESETGGKLAEAVVKRLTGSDTVSARFLYGEYFEFNPTFKIFMATNHKPRVTGMDDAIWRRLKLIPFEVSFKEKQRDPDLPNKLDAELSGILAWMIEGCILWKKEGLGNPPKIAEATKSYRYEMSAIETFLQEKCTTDVNEMVKASHLYNAFVDWADANNERIISMRSFGMRLSESGMEKERLSTGYHWLGIKLNYEDPATGKTIKGV